MLDWSSVDVMAEGGMEKHSEEQKSLKKKAVDPSDMVLQAAHGLALCVLSSG